MEEEQQEDTTSRRYDGWEDTYNTLLMRLDPTPTLERIKHLLMNYKYDEPNDKWVPIMINGKPIKRRMTQEGIEKLMLELYGRMSIDKVLSNLKETKINLFVKQLGEVLLQFLWFNTDEFDIKEGEYESIIWLVLHNVEIFLRRALLGSENRLLNKSMEMKEVHQRNVRDMDGGGMGGFAQGGKSSKWLGGMAGGR